MRISLSGHAVLLTRDVLATLSLPGAKARRDCQPTLADHGLQCCEWGGSRRRGRLDCFGRGKQNLHARLIFFGGVLPGPVESKLFKFNRFNDWLSGSQPGDQAVE